MENVSSYWQSFLPTILFQFLFHIPIIAVCIIGIIIAFTKSEKYPRISFLSGAGFGILLIVSILSSLLSPLAPYLVSRRYDAQTIGSILSGITFVFMLINAAASALLIRAVWKDRP